MLKKFNIDVKAADEIESLMLGDNNNIFNWFYNNSSARDYEKNNNDVDSPQLVHQFFCDGKIWSPYYDKIMKLLLSFKLPFSKIQIYRIKANLTFNLTGASYDKYQPIHTDVDDKDFKSFLYYVNDSDGDTLFFNDKDEIVERISPKKGMGILFNSNVRHAAQNPINSNKRAVINYILKGATVLVNPGKNV